MNTHDQTTDPALAGANDLGVRRAQDGALTAATALGFFFGTVFGLAVALLAVSLS